MNELNEALILVDAEDRALGPGEKSACHDGEGVLHRAFSLFIFDDSGRLLMQKRAPGKRLWPGFWSNSCCSHPRWGEEMLAAVMRRPYEELGLAVEDVTFAYKFEYQAAYEDKGSERELCHVFFARALGEVSQEPSEVEAWRYLYLDELTRELSQNPDAFTPWFKMEWQHLNTHFPCLLKNYSQKTTASAPK